METIQAANENHSADKNKLLRILGVTFGLAVVIGGTIGVGILRSPGAVAAQLGSVWLVILVWTLGGVYSLLGANYTAELATMIPKAGGPYVYAHRAYGDYGGFVVGWSDWLLNTLSIAYISIVFGEYAAALLAPNFSSGVVVFSVTILLLLTALNWIGLRAGSGTQKLTSLLKAIALLGFIVACFIFGGQNNSVSAEQTTVIAPSGFALFTGFILAFQLVLGTYAGWNSAVYFAEEDTNPEQNIPRSMFGGIALIIAIYLLVNLALLYVLPLSQMAASKFAGADAMNLIFGERSGQIITVLALLSIIGIINANLMFTPRTLLALGRDGLFLDKAATVNKGGTPVFALLMTVLPAIILITIGTFEILLAVTEFFAVTNTILLIGSLFLLRRREPDLPRPFRAWGYPFAPLVMLLAAILLFFGYIVSNLSNSLYAIVALATSYPIFLLIKKTRAR
ncbi:MAG: amino acid permease [Acidobacteria bacterium]|jgi:APA family basic amino acid/polyamine antiporter|nr:amino acid permease [Acidobacteriota bacterium]